MSFFKRFAALVLAGAMCLSLLTGCQDGDASSSVDIVGDINLTEITDISLYTTGIPGDTVVATMGDVNITLEELLYWVAWICDDIYYYYSTYYGLTEIPWDLEVDDMTMAEYFVQDALEGAAFYHLIRQQAQAEGLAMTEDQSKEIQATLDEISAEQDEEGIKMEYYMRQYIMSEESFRWYCECEYLLEALTAKYYGEGTEGYPTDEVVLDYLEDNGVYATKHILLATIDTSTYASLDEATIAQKKTTIDGLLAQIRASDDPAATFETLLKEYGEDPGLETAGGSYVSAPGVLAEEYEKAATALEVGQISDVVETSAGYHIIMRIALTAEDAADYRESYITAMMQEKRDAWLDEAQIQTNETFDKVDAKSFFEKLEDYRVAVARS